jgi:hypothetical protein
MITTQTIELSEEIYLSLMAEAALRGITVEEWIKSHLPLNGRAEEQTSIGQRLRDKGLIGMIDSSRLDPCSPPIQTRFGELLIEKFRKQGLKFS